jgi:hypothetical protein
MPYRQVIETIKVQGRPVRCEFGGAGAGGPVSVTFTEAGSLGLKFTPNKQTGDVELLQVNPGTQAERHPQLAAGLILQNVAGASVVGKSYQEVLGMIKAGGRPISMTFVHGGAVPTSPRTSPRQLSAQQQAMQIVAQERNTTPVRAQQPRVCLLFVLLHLCR